MLSDCGGLGEEERKKPRTGQDQEKSASMQPPRSKKCAASTVMNRTIK